MQAAARSNRGLLAAAALGLTLLSDAELQEAIRQHLEERRGKARQGRTRRSSGAGERHSELREQRRKLEGRISAEQFGEEQARLTLEIEALEAEDQAAVTETIETDELTERFEQVVALLADLDIGTLWEHATEAEKRSLLDEMLDHVKVLPDRLVVTIHGAPPLNVGFGEVGLKEPADSAFRGVGGGT